MSLQKKNIKHAILFISGLAIFAGFIYFTNAEDLRKLKHVRLFPLLGALFCTFLITASISGRWGTMVNSLLSKKIAPWYQYYHFFLLSRTLGFILPKDLTDFGVRISWLKKKHHIPISKAGFTVFLDRIFDVMFMFLFLLSVVPFWLGLIGPTVSIFLMIFIAGAFGLLLIFRNAVIFHVLSAFYKLLIEIPRFIPFLKKRISPQTTTIPIIPKKQIVRVFCLSIIKFVTTAFRLYLFALALNLDISFKLFLLGTPLGQLSFLFAFTPGGLGIFEAGWYGILTLAGITTDKVLLFVIGQRIFTIILVLIMFLISTLFSFVKNQEKSNENN
jgi:uncharacterized protein (TIRG00374 family)